MRLVRLIDAAESKTPLRGLWEACMRGFDLPDFIYNLSRCEMYGHYPQLGYWDEKRRGEFGEMFAKVQGYCAAIGLPVARQVASHWERMESGSYEVSLLSKDLSGIRNTIVNELKDYLYLEIPKDDVKLYKQAEQFSPAVFKAFRRAEKDLRAASTCLALDQGTACVFHLMRAMEVAVQKFGKRVARFSPRPIVIDMYRDTWGSILNKLRPVIEKSMPNNTLHERRRKERFEEIYTSLDHVKRAWRNKTAHPRQIEYEPKDARRIYNAVQGFMETLAGEI